MLPLTRLLIIRWWPQGRTHQTLLDIGLLIFHWFIGAPYEAERWHLVLSYSIGRTSADYTHNRVCVCHTRTFVLPSACRGVVRECARGGRNPWHAVKPHRQKMGRILALRDVRWRPWQIVFWRRSVVARMEPTRVFSASSKKACLIDAR